MTGETFHGVGLHSANLVFAGICELCVRVHGGAGAVLVVTVLFLDLVLDGSYVIA